MGKKVLNNKQFEVAFPLVSQRCAKKKATGKTSTNGSFKGKALRHTTVVFIVVYVHV
jgi:hypothetical protein